MAYIPELESDNNNFKDLSTESLSIWRNVRIIDTHVSKATFADNCYCKGSNLGRDVLINKGAFILNSQIDDKSQIGFNTKVMHAKIGKYCSISWDCSIGGSNHSIHTLSTYNHRNQSHYSEKDCIIGNDVWMGTGVIMMRGISVGNGAVVGGGSVLTHSVLPYEVVAGVPARHLGWRFPEVIRRRLEDLKWWDLPESVIQDNLELFDEEVNEDIIKKLEILKNRLYESK